MNNIKDKLTTIAGIAFAIATGTIIASTKFGIAMPPIVDQIAAGVAAVAGSILFYLTGKNPDGTTKTPEQVEAANKGK